jgi:hypothetical protein
VARRALLLATVAALLAAGPAHAQTEPPAGPTPQAQCQSGSKPEPGIQGRLPKEEVDSGRADDGYWCNLTRIGHVGVTGGFRVHRYVDKAGHECAYYDTALLFPTNALNLSLDLTGVAVLDMSDPRNPVRTTTLVTPAMQTPHESLTISTQRGVLAAVMGNPAQYPGGVDVYDISQDCRFPVPKAAAFPATPFGHEGGMAPDGLTYYPSSPASNLSAVDISDQSVPKQLWTTDETATHGLTLSPDGRRAYLASIDHGLIILDTSEIQDRKPNPQGREISRLKWSNMTIPQNAIPVRIKGKPYVVEVDEYSESEGGDFGGHGDRVGAARIIDISDERKPFVVSNIRLAVHNKENRGPIAGDYGAQSPVQGYAAHYCNVPKTVDPGIVACSMIMSGLRVFDIRDPEHPREIAYHMAPPSNVSETGGPVIDERGNWAMSQPAFAPERGEIWYSDGTSGFWNLKMDPDVWPFKGDAAGGGGSDCLRPSSLRFKIHRGRRGRVVRVDAYANGKRWLRRTGRDIPSVTLKRLKRGGKLTIRIVATHATGSKVVSSRTWNGCSKGKPRVRRIPRS